MHLDVRVDKQAVRFGVNILHGHLKPVKAPRLRQLNFAQESSSEVLENNAIAGCEECKYMLDEMLLSVVEFIPILLVLR
jgi:hypothetical protein